jgi:hypothetical protein
MKEKHADQITFQCRKCDKEYKSKHAAQCHIPKCPGKKAPVVGGYSCEECGDTFATKSGLSQHKRHHHPLVGNMERISDPPRLRAPRGGVGFSAEVQTLLQLEITYKDEPDILTKMTELLKTKTRKQIRDKRLEPAYIRKRADMAAANQLNDSGARMANVVQTPVLRRLRGSRIPIRTPSPVLVNRLSRLANSTRRSTETVAVGDEPPNGTNPNPSPQARPTEAEDEKMSDDSATVVPATVHMVPECETEEPSQL